MAILAVLYAVHSLTEASSRLISSGVFTRSTNRGFWDSLLLNGAGELVMEIGPFVVLCLLSVLLWAFANPLGSVIAGRNASAQGTLSFAITASDALVMLFSAIGIYLVISGTPLLTNFIGWQIFLRDTDSAYTAEEVRHALPQLLGAVSSFTFGWLLVFGARFLARLLPATRSLMARDPLADTRDTGRDLDLKVGGNAEVSEANASPHAAEKA